MMRLKHFILHAETKTTTDSEEKDFSVSSTGKKSGGFEGAFSSTTDNTETFIAETSDIAGTFTATVGFSAPQEEAATTDIIIVLEKES